MRGGRRDAWASEWLTEMYLRLTCNREASEGNEYCSSVWETIGYLLHSSVYNYTKLMEMKISIQLRAVVTLWIICAIRIRTHARFLCAVSNSYVNNATLYYLRHIRVRGSVGKIGRRNIATHPFPLCLIFALNSDMNVNASYAWFHLKHRASSLGSR